MERSFSITGRDINTSVAEVVEYNFKNYIPQRMSIYFIPRIASEKFCIYKSSTKKKCYLAWNDTDYFIKLPNLKIENRKKSMTIFG